MNYTETKKSGASIDFEIMKCRGCGAECRYKKDRPRFLKRHGGPKPECQKRKEFNQRLAAGTRSTEPTTFEEHKELNAN